MDQSTTPYAEALNQFGRRDLVRVIVPGHSAQTGGVPQRLADFIAENPFNKDFTPLLTGLDKGPNNPLLQAKRLAAEAWGARKVWFLTNGASQGNRVTALALASRGTAVVAQRSAHSSFVDGLILSGLRPSFVSPSVDAHLGVAHGIQAVDLHRALENAPADVAGVYVISPSYFGAVSDVQALADVAHQYNLPLIVDAAWGAHFGFHPDLPANPLTLGADLVISSTHKLAGSLTQSAMLHLAEGPFGAELETLVGRAFGLTQSTSENTWLLASLDIARHALVNDEASIARSIGAASDLREKIRNHPWLRLVEDRFDRFEDIVGHDPLHVGIDISEGGFSGHAIKELVADDDGVYFEMATERTLVAIIGAGSHPDTNRILASLDQATERLKATNQERLETASGLTTLPPVGPTILTPRDAFLGATEIIDADQAVGRVSADTLAAYPPGIPSLMPGELITPETAAFLRRVARSAGGYVRGAADPLVDSFRVVRQP